MFSFHFPLVFTRFLFYTLTHHRTLRFSLILASGAVHRRITTADAIYLHRRNSSHLFLFAVIYIFPFSFFLCDGNANPNSSIMNLQTLPRKVADLSSEF